MTSQLRIVIADDEQDMRDYFERVLPRLGHRVAGVARTGRELIALCQQVQPDMVISDVKMPEMDGIDAAIELYRERPLAVLLVSAFYEDALVERAASDHVLAYLVKPIKQADLGAAITLAWRRFQDMEQLKSQIPTPKSDNP